MAAMLVDGGTGWVVSETAGDAALFLPIGRLPPSIPNGNPGQAFLDGDDLIVSFAEYDILLLAFPTQLIYRLMRRRGFVLAEDGKGGRCWPVSPA